MAALIQGTASADHLEGTPQHDEIHGGGGPDRIYSYGGNDTVFGGPGSDSIYLGPGNDRACGGPGGDYIGGGRGDDILKAGNCRHAPAGGYILAGELGADRLFYAQDMYGGPGPDTLHLTSVYGQLARGGHGNDLIYTQNDGNLDYIYCGDGTDRVIYRDVIDSNDVLSNCESVEVQGP